MAHPMGLYYPFIHFKDDHWLKLVALYWPKLARIVPSDYPTEDQETVKRLAGELQFVIDVNPEPSVGGVGESFAKLLAEHSAGLQERYGISKRLDWPPDPVTKAYAPARAKEEPSLAYVYAAEMHSDLLEALKQTGLVLPAASEPSWIGMHPRLADVYMSALTDHLAEANQDWLCPVTDKTLDHVAVSGWDMPHLGQALLGKQMMSAPPVEGADLSKSLGMLAIEAVVPKDLDQVPIDRIINVRKNHGEEFDAFRTHIDELAAGLASVNNIQNPEVAQAILQQEYETKLGPELDHLRSVLSSSKLDTARAVLNVQTALPTLVASAAALAGITIHPAIAFGGGAAFGILPMLGAYRQRTNELTSGSPVAYLLRVEKEMQPPTLIQQLTERGRRFLGA
jgi:hypothetical protein